MKFLDAIPYDIVIFAILSIVLGLRLWRVLGKRMGTSDVAYARPVAPVRKPADAAPAQQPAEPVATRDIPAQGTRVGQVLERIAQAEPGFSPDRFLQGVETSFRTIVAAFAAGDRDKLRSALTQTAYEVFDTALTAREGAGEVLNVRIVSVQSLTIQDAGIDDVTSGVTRGMVEVLIVSRQVSQLNGRDSEPLVGTDAVTEFSDLWRFERVFGARIGGASWRLAAARAA